jgi:DNA-binding transcriptional regulator/RsmH inhibitor MraZ
MLVVGDANSHDKHRFTIKLSIRSIVTLMKSILLLGREIVFELFNIEFIQAEERIEFKWRGEIASSP